MDKPNIIHDLETKLKISLHPFTGELEELMRYRYQNHYLLDADGQQLLGLNVRSNQLSDAHWQHLASITTIQALNASENEFVNLALPIAWKELRFLDLSENKNLGTFKMPHIRLHQIEWMDLNECALSSFELPILTGIRKLDISRNTLAELIVEGSCPALEILDASGNQLTSFELRGFFNALKYLYLNNNHLETFHTQRDLPALEILHLRGNNLQDLPDWTAFMNLQALYLHGNPLRSLPKEVIAEDEDASSWVAVRAFLLNLQQGEHINDRVKIILVGNGRVGKTSLFKRLKNLPLDIEEPYTHGISLGELNANDLGHPVKTGTLRASVWDFGGQEIFYATHQFFLSADALYILAWTAQENVLVHRERDQAQMPFSEKEKWQSCEYWLENIRLHGKNSPILMVQTHSDQHREPIRAAYQEDYGAECLNFSAAKPDYGLTELRELIAQRLDAEIPFFGQRIPVCYEVLIRELEEKRADEPVISRAAFDVLCQAAEVMAGTETEVLEYLHRTGVVVFFGQDGLRDVVYINPNWLTSEVYRLINKELEPREGRIDAAWLRQQLPEYDASARQRFLQLLENFRLIFADHDEEGPFWIAPQYLPPTLRGNAKTGYNIIARDLRPAFAFHFPKFIPDNVMINFLSHYGPSADKMYWRNGICFTSAGTKCSVTFRAADNCLMVATDGSERSRALQKEVSQAFVQLSKNANAEISLDGERFISWQQLLEAVENKAETIPTTDKTGKLNVADFALFTGRGEVDLVGKGRMEEKTGPPVLAKPVIYFSYAWGISEKTGANREQIVNDLYDSLEADGKYELKRDKKDVSYRQSIQEFMRALGKAQTVVVVISDKYLKSPNCMFELLQIFRKSNSETADFQEKIIPIVLGDAQIYDPIDRLEYVGFWKNKCNKLEEKILEIGLADAKSAVPDFDSYYEIKQNIGTLAGILADLNTLSPIVLAGDDFAEIKNTMLQTVGKISRETMTHPTFISIPLATGLTIPFVHIPGGEFLMGNDQSLNEDDKPAHLVQLDDFYIGKFPVTQALWKAVMDNENSAFFLGDDRPMEQVPWNDITEKFLPLLYECTNIPFRLPTEAEWEYAARGGPYWQNGFQYMSSSKLKEVGWSRGYSHDETKPVGLKSPNQLGLYDMSGNVWEWCQDWYAEDYYEECYTKGIVSNPRGPAEGGHYILRGGSYWSDVQECRVAARLNCDPTSIGSHIGFRLAVPFNSINLSKLVNL